MKKLIFLNWALSEENLAVIQDQIQVEIDEGNEIYLLQCKGELKPCFFNAESARANCWTCTFNTHSLIDRFGGLVKVLIVNKVTHSDFQYDFKNVNDLKFITYREVNIGYAALSNFATNTRNQSPDFSNNLFKEHFIRMLNVSIIFTDYLYDLFSRESFDEVILFNGRTNDSRPLFDVALAFKINVKVLELNKFGNLIRKNIFDNCLPQNIAFANKRILETWDNAPLEESEKIDIGSSFYFNRRKGKLAAAVQVFTVGQKEGFLPNNIGDKKAIVIFNSSEDEFAAIGKDWDNLNLFKDQIEGIRFICENASDEYNIFLRIHPNLKGIEYDYHTHLLELSKFYKNLTVIPSESPVSTYALIDASEKVIIFGSSTGAEAVFSNKPVILLGGCFYYHLNITYNPESKQQFFVLLNSSLKAKDKLNAIKYGFFLLYPQYYSKTISGSSMPIMFRKRLRYVSHSSIRYKGSKIFHIALLLFIKTLGFFDKKLLKNFNVIPK